MKGLYLIAILVFLSPVLLVGQSLEKRIRNADQIFFQENFEEAYNEYSKIKKDFPGEKQINYHMEVSYLLSIGRGKPVDKVLAYETSRGTQDRLYYYWLGLIYFENYDFDKSIESFNKFLSRDDFKSKTLQEDARVFIEWSRTAAAFYANPNEFEIVPLPKNVNSKYSDISPTYFGNNDELLFMSSREEASNSDDAVYRVFHAIRESETEWKDPTRVEEFGAFTLLNAKIEVVNADGKAFTFKDGSLNFSEPSGNSWTTPKNFDSKLSAEYVESHFFINDQEDVIIFSSDKDVEGVSLYESRKDPSTGAWSEPKLLPSSVNSEYFEDSPYLSHDGQYLYFSSNRESSIGGYDIFRSKWDAANNTWLPAENLGYPINTIDDEIHFQLNEDNASGYFSSNRLHSQGDYDLYFFKKEIMIQVAGTVSDSDGNTINNTDLVFRPSKYTDESFPTKTDENGKYVVSIFANEPFEVELQSDDLESNKLTFTATPDQESLELQKDLVFEIGNKQEDKIAQADMDDSEEDIKRQEEELADLENIGSKYRSASSVDIENIYFEFASDVLKSDSEQVIKTITEMMNSFPKAKIKIVGHTDNVGKEEYNLELSKKRAQSLKKELISRGISSSRIQTEGEGEKKPVASNNVEENGRALNRRIEIVVID